MRNELRESLLTTAREMVPVLRSRAPEAERNRRLHQETHETFHKAGFYKILQPKRWGGHETDLSLLVDLAAEIGRGCGSAAWIFTNLVMQGWHCGMKDPRAQEEVWGDDPETLIASSFPGPDASLRRVDGGFVVSGSWNFSSGIDFASWNHIQLFYAPDGGKQQNLYALVPKSAYEVVDNWHVTALAATGSRGLRIHEHFIPDYRVINPADANSGQSPGSAINPGVLYRMPWWGIGGKAFASPAVGIARGALECLEEDISTRKAARGPKLWEQQTVQSRVAESGAEIDLAWAALVRDCDEATRMTEDGVTPDLVQCTRWRRNNAYAIVMCVRAVERLFVLNGMRGMKADDPVQRAWREVHAAGCQAGNTWDLNATNYGRARFGLMTGDPRVGG